MSRPADIATPNPCYVNNAQEVVGIYNSNPLNTVFLWKDGVTHDLDLTALNLPEDSVVDTPFLNDEGVVVGVIPPTGGTSPAKIYRINTRSQNPSPAELIYESSGSLSIFGWTNNGQIYFVETMNAEFVVKVWSGGSLDTLLTAPDLYPVGVNNRDEILAYRGRDVVLLVGEREFKVTDLTETPLRTNDPIEPIAIGDGGHILLRQGGEGLLLTPTSTEAL